MGSSSRQFGAGKKLIAAARHWARGGKQDHEEALKDAHLMGVSSADAKAWLGVTEDKEEGFLVHPDNWQVLRVFLALSTQWRIIINMGNAIWQGLDYSVIPAVMEMMDIPRDKQAETFTSLRLMESAALEEIRKITK